jgi:hypothetical protein
MVNENGGELALVSPLGSEMQNQNTWKDLKHS